MQTIPDKQGNPIDIHHRSGQFKISPYERDAIYQRFVQEFPDKRSRRGILREFKDKSIRSKFIDWARREAKRAGETVSADRIDNFVSQAVAAEAGVLPKSERWDWWVGCSIGQRRT